jgi:hypothetical protein
MSLTKEFGPLGLSITNLPLATTETLLTEQYWFTPSITFITIPYAPQNSTYICSIENLTYLEPDSKAILEPDSKAILELIKMTINEREQVANLVAWINTEHNAYRSTLQSMHIKPLRLGIPAKL